MDIAAYYSQLFFRHLYYAKIIPSIIYQGGLLQTLGHIANISIRTQSGRVLVRNQHFLCKRIPISTLPLATPCTTHRLLRATFDAHGPEPPSAIPIPQHFPRRSSRSCKKTTRLIETYRIQWELGREGK